MFSSYKIERMGFGLLLCFALLMAFEPLVRLHDPNGARIGDALDLRAGIAQTQSELRILAPAKPSPNGGASVDPVTACDTRTLADTLHFTDSVACSMVCPRRTGFLSPGAGGSSFL